MHYEKAEHILQQLLAGDKNHYLVKNQEGKITITNVEGPNYGRIKKRQCNWFKKLIFKIFSIKSCRQCPFKDKCNSVGEELQKAKGVSCLL